MASDYVHSFQYPSGYNYVVKLNGTTVTAVDIQLNKGDVISISNSSRSFKLTDEHGYDSGEISSGTINYTWRDAGFNLTLSNVDRIVEGANVTVNIVAESETTFDLTALNLSAGDYAITVVAEADGYTDSDVSNSVTYSVQPQLAAPVIAMNSDGKTLEITDVENATSYDVYVDGTLKTNVVRVVSSTLTFVSAKTDFLGGSETYAKIGSAPTSNSDYQYSCSKTGTYEFTGSVDVYVWGSDGANSGGYAIDSISQDSMIKVNAWSSPTKLTFTESKSLCLFQAEMM